MGICSSKEKPAQLQGGAGFTTKSPKGDLSKAKHKNEFRLKFDKRLGVYQLKARADVLEADIRCDRTLTVHNDRSATSLTSQAGPANGW